MNGTSPSSACTPCNAPNPEHDPMQLRGYITLNVGNMRLEFGLNEVTEEQAVASLTAVANKALSVISAVYAETPEE